LSPFCLLASYSSFPGKSSAFFRLLQRGVVWAENSLPYCCRMKWQDQSVSQDLRSPAQRYSRANQGLCHSLTCFLVCDGKLARLLSDPHLRLLPVGEYRRQSVAQQLLPCSNFAGGAALLYQDLVGRHILRELPEAVWSTPRSASLLVGQLGHGLS